MNTKISYNQVYTLLFDEANRVINDDYKTLLIHLLSHICDCYARDYRLSGTAALDELIDAYNFIKSE